MSTGKSSVRSRLEEALRGFMDKPVEDLTVEELDMVLRSCRALRADAHEEDNAELYRAAGKVMEKVREHWQLRVAARDARDRVDGREF